MTGAVIVFLPYPPTANNLFPTGKNGRRFPSREYEAWKKEAGLKLNAQRPGAITGRVAVLYEFRKPDNRRRDVANLEKATTDLLVSQSVIEDDCLIEEMSLRWVYDVPWEARATIRGLTQ